MKRFMPALLAFTLWTSLLWSAPQLEIHHINIGNGDSTIIGVKEDDDTYSFLMLIDGGMKSGGSILIPYLKDVEFPRADNLAKHVGEDMEVEDGNESHLDFESGPGDEVVAKAGYVPDVDMGGNDDDMVDEDVPDPIEFDYIILSHYHQDHYKGLIDLLKDGRCKTERLIDPGGPGGNGPVQQPKKYLDAAYIALWDDRITTWYGMAEDRNFFDAPIELRAAQGNVPAITLDAIVRNGLVKNPNGGNHAQDVGASPNDRSIGWVLKCGEFKYFTGGDLAGDTLAVYRNHETNLASYLRAKYKHVCAFKANHHGSEHSNHQAFLRAMMPTVCITSAGTHTGWKLPTTPFIQRLRDNVVNNNLHPAADATIFFYRTQCTQNGPQKRRFGFLFTNLSNFAGGVAKESRNKVVNTLANLDNAYVSYGFDYILKVPLVNNLNTGSSFTVEETRRIDPATQERVQGGVNDPQLFNCHYKQQVVDHQGPGRGVIKNEGGPRTGSLLKPLIK